MPWAIREYEVIGVETLNDIRRGNYVAVFDNENEAYDELDRLVNELRRELESDENIAIVDEDEFGFCVMDKKELEEIVEEREGIDEPMLSGYDYIGYEIVEVSEEEAKDIIQSLH
jgi:hypothetical protein